MEGEMKYIIAVFDIGKTHKKFFLYDQDLRIIDMQSANIPSIEQDNILVENLSKTTEWFYQCLRNTVLPIRSIAVSTHGASIVCVDDDGEAVLPLLDYTFEPAASFHETFWQSMPDTLKVQTATPETTSLINPAKQIFFLQQKYTDKFRTVKHILFYPQYFGMLLTGKCAVDYSSATNHTYLWDFYEKRFSQAVDILNISQHLPSKPAPPYQCLGTLSDDAVRKTHLSPETIVTVGIHDSNAALLTYLMWHNAEKIDFALNSTGTWSVALHPETDVSITADEISKMIFYNYSAFMQPIRNAIFPSGIEFDAYTSLLKKIHMQDLPQNAVWDSKRIDKLCKDSTQFILPGILKNTGQFPHSTARILDGNTTYFFEDIKKGKGYPALLQDWQQVMDILNLSLAVQTCTALEYVNAAQDTVVYVSGGFCSNAVYLQILASVFGELYTAEMQEATGFWHCNYCQSRKRESSSHELKTYAFVSYYSCQSRAYTPF